jgi:hypothetical protein
MMIPLVSDAWPPLTYDDARPPTRELGQIAAKISQNHLLPKITPLRRELDPARVTPACYL